MAEIRPFRALRPIPELICKIAELPYDVMNQKEARDMLRQNPLSFLQVTRSDAALPESIAEDDPQVYEKARENLETYISRGEMIQDSTPCYYIYRQQMGPYIQIGLVAVASLKEYEDKVIRKHELTREKKERDRVQHILATKAQTGPVFLAYKSKGQLSAFLLDYMGNHTPTYDFTGEDEVRHTLYVMNEPLKVQEVTRLFRQVPQLYIADGHHRCEAAYQVAKQLGARKGQTGTEEYNYVLSVIFPSSMLHILPYHRLIRDLGGLTAEDFLKKVSVSFDVEDLTRPAEPSVPHTFCLYLGGKWRRLTAKEGTYDAADPIKSLDTSILQDPLLSAILGSKDPRKDPRLDFMGGIRGLKGLMDAVDSGAFMAAIAMYPTTMEELIRVADAGLIMPPKSTWFEPKLRDAMTIHLIGDEQDGKNL